MLTITRTHFEKNMAIGRGVGAAMAIFGNARIEDSVFLENTSQSDGGAVHIFGSQYTIKTIIFERNLFQANSATANGGAVNIHGSNEDADAGSVNAQFFNNTFVGNSADHGSAFHISAPGATLQNNTIVDTLADRSGGENVYEGPRGIISKDFNNLVVKQSPNPDAHNCTLLGGADGTTGGNNLANDGSCGEMFAVKTLDELVLGEYGAWGGETATVPLLPGSAAIDAGDDANCPATDARGIARPQLAHCDVGAYEVQPYTLRITSGNHKYTPVTESFNKPLTVEIIGASVADRAQMVEPTEGGTITFSAPAGGASIVRPTRELVIQDGRVSIRVKANAVRGAYVVTANTTGAASAAEFHLTNVQSNALLLAPADGSRSNTRSVVFQWEPMPNADGKVRYTLNVTSKGKFVFQQVLTDETQFVSLPLDAGKDYSWSVKMCSAGKCISSATWKFAVKTRAQ